MVFGGVDRGTVRGIERNRRFGLQAAASNRADERLKLEQSRANRRSGPRGLGSVQQPQADEGTFFTRENQFFARDEARGLGADQGIQIIKPPAGLAPEGQQGGFAMARRERKILDALQSQGINAARAQLNPDGSIEVLGNDGQSGILNPQNSAKILQTLDPNAQKAALKDRELGLRERGLDLQEQSQKKKIETGAITVGQQRKHVILSDRVKRAVRRLNAAQDVDDVVDKEAVARAQAGVDRAEQDLDNFLEELFPDQREAALAAEAEAEVWRPNLPTEQPPAPPPPTQQEIKQDKIRTAQKVVADKDNQDPVAVLNAEAIISVAKKQATEAAQAELSQPLNAVKLATVDSSVKEGTTVVNRKTGERMILKDGRWQEL